MSVQQTVKTLNASKDYRSPSHSSPFTIGNACLVRNNQEIVGGSLKGRVVKDSSEDELYRLSPGLAITPKKQPSIRRSPQTRGFAGGIEPRHGEAHEDPRRALPTSTSDHDPKERALEKPLNSVANCARGLLSNGRSGTTTQARVEICKTDINGAVQHPTQLDQACSKESRAVLNCSEAPIPPMSSRKDHQSTLLVPPPARGTLQSLLARKRVTPGFVGEEIVKDQVLCSNEPNVSMLYAPHALTKLPQPRRKCISKSQNPRSDVGKHRRGRESQVIATVKGHKPGAVHASASEIPSASTSKAATSRRAADIDEASRRVQNENKRYLNLSSDSIYNVPTSPGYSESEALQRKHKPRSKAFEQTVGTTTRSARRSTRLSKAQDNTIGPDSLQDAGNGRVNDRMPNVVRRERLSGKHGRRQLKGPSAKEGKHAYVSGKRNRSPSDVVANATAVHPRPSSRSTGQANKQVASCGGGPEAIKDEEVPQHRQDLEVDHPRKGSSTQDPILVSDLVESGSLESPSPLAIREYGTTAPCGPARISASRPKKVDRISTPSADRLLDPNTFRRTDTISFDKNGPRNQGRCSAAGTCPSSRHGDSKAVESIARLSTSINNAQLGTGGPSLPEEGGSTARLPSSSENERSTNVAENATVALAGFWRATRSSVAQLAQVGASSGPVMVQKQELPLVTSANADDKGVSNVGDEWAPPVACETPFQAVESLPMRKFVQTASQIQMPPPTRKECIEGAQGAALDIQSAPETNVEMSPVRKFIIGGMKRTSCSESIDQAKAKRIRIRDIKSSKLDHRAAGLQHHMSAASNSDQKPKQLQQAKKEVHTIVVQPAHSEHTRHVSQSTVDVCGSPVPRDMDLPDGMTTVLEAFAGRSEFSSESGSDYAIGTLGGPIVSAAMSTTEIKVRSNGRAKCPASSINEKKQMIGGVLEKTPEATVTKHFPITKLNSRNTVGIRQDDPSKDIKLGNVASFGVDNQPSFLQVLRESAKISSGIFQGTVDVDKTLVDEPTPCDKLECMLSRSSPTTESSSDDVERKTLMTELGLWQKDLQPHQANLFKELVQISHGLVHHLLEREVANVETADHYRKQGVHLIERMELNHAKQHQDRVESLASQKRSLFLQLEDISARFDDFGKGLRMKRISDGNLDDVVVGSLDRLMRDFCP